jgi:hypothetical protein
MAPECPGGTPAVLVRQAANLGDDFCGGHAVRFHFFFGLGFLGVTPQA